MKYFVKGEVLASVRKRYSYPLAVFAEKVNSETETVSEWESLGAELTTAKMELIADTISCHWSVLLRDEPLPVVERPKSKRAANGRGHVAPKTSTLIVYREAYRLLDSIHMSKLPKMSNRLNGLTTSKDISNPEAMARSFANLVEYKHETRHKLRDQRAVYKYFVEHLERNGIFVSEQDLDTDDIRGFLISKSNTNLIVISSADKFPASRLFTLLHEVGHILRGSGSSACDLRSMNADLSKVDSEEKFCDSFAAALLMPKLEFEKDKRVIEISHGISDDALSKLASSYRTSYPAVLRRLYSLKLIHYRDYRMKTKEFYDEILPKILANMRRPKNDDFKLPRSYYVNREIKKASRSFTDFVISRYSSGDISSGEAKRLLGVDTRYLVEIEKVLGTG